MNRGKKVVGGWTGGVGGDGEGAVTATCSNAAGGRADGEAISSPGHRACPGKIDGIAFITLGNSATGINDPAQVIAPFRSSDWDIQRHGIGNCLIDVRSRDTDRSEKNITRGKRRINGQVAINAERSRGDGSVVPDIG